MRRKTDLYHLIKSLSKAEKRYFMLDAKKSGREDARYIQLYQAIQKMDAYEEEVLKAEFGRRLSDDKARLYEAILRAMRDYRSVHSKSARIKEMILDAKFLYERGLYDQWEERLEGAKALADELEDFLALLDINREERLAKNRKFVHEPVTALNGLIADKNQIIDSLKEELHYLDTYNEVWYKLVSWKGQMDPEKKAELLEQFQQRLLATDIPDGFQAKVQYYQSRAMLAQFQRNPLEANRNYEALMEEWNEYPFLKDEEFHRYIVHASNHLHILAQTPELAPKFPEVLESLERERPTSLHDRVVLFHRTATFRLFYYINYGKDANLFEVLRPIERGLREFTLPSSAELLICFNAGFLLFLGESYDESKEWFSKVIESRDAWERQDLLAGARLIEFIITVESEEIDLVDSRLRSIGRFLQKYPDPTLKDFAFTFMGLVKKYLAAPLLEESDRLDDLLQFLETTQKSKERPPLGLDELFAAWAKSRKVGKTIREVL